MNKAAKADNNIFETKHNHLLTEILLWEENYC
jgi:hypothetical protein